MVSQLNLIKIILSFIDNVFITSSCSLISLDLGFQGEQDIIMLWDILRGKCMHKYSMHTK